MHIALGPAAQQEGCKETGKWADLTFVGGATAIQQATASADSPLCASMAPVAHPAIAGFHLSCFARKFSMMHSLKE